MTFKHPSSFYSELSDERLAKIAEPLLDIRYSTLQEMASLWMIRIRKKLLCLAVLETCSSICVPATSTNG